MSPAGPKIPEDPKERAISKGDVSQAALVMQMSRMNQGSSKSHYLDPDWEDTPQHDVTKDKPAERVELKSKESE